MRPIDDGFDLLPDELPRIRVRPDDDDPPAGVDVRGEEPPLHGQAPAPDHGAADSEAGGPGRRANGKLLLTVLVIAGLAAGGAWLLQPDTLPIRQVHMEGEFRQLSRQELQTIVLERLHGGFFGVNVTAIHDAMHANPWVREVSVQRIWPDTLRVSIREQIAVARWGEDGLVSAGGDTFRPQPDRMPADLPRLVGPDGTQEQMAAKLRVAQELLGPHGLQLERLELSGRRAWSFTTRSGLEVVLGREDFEGRLRRFVDLVPGSLGERMAEAAYVDMRYPNGFAVRFHESGGPPADGEGAV